MNTPSYEVVWTRQAANKLSAITDVKTRMKIIERGEQLALEPEKQGKPLTGELSGLRSVQAAGQRYRIIYKIEKSRILVIVVAAGIRKEGDKSDVYNLAKRLFRLRLLE